ncbi:MAG: spore coat protein CotJB [Alicyclobacillaceae bacterium]|nr:spore coat protein CotJB [Alicyclobacillaceae bacterium]
MNTSVPRDYYQLLEELQTIDFVLVELNLYLDTHPEDVHALQQYRAWSERRREVKARFESRFGPLQPDGAGGPGLTWDWNRSPWPWQV